MYLRRYLRYGPQIFQTTPPYENLKFRVKKVLFSTRRQRAQYTARPAHFREQAHYVNLAQPSDATPLPRHLWSLKRPVFSTGSRIQFARAIFSSVIGEGEPRDVTAAGLLARRYALLKWSRNAPIASDARPTATRRTRERRQQRITMVYHRAQSHHDSLPRAQDARVPLAVAARE